MSDIQEWLDKGHALADQATEGPWEVEESSDGWSEIYGRDPIEPMVTPTVATTERGGENEAAFIADARTRLPLALVALQAVLDLHKPVEVEPSATICGECSNTLPNGRFLPIAEHPCPTFLAIKEALGENNE